MPRINIEDSLFLDIRYQHLVEKTGSRASALGSVILAWIVAQKYWLDNCRLVPIVEFKRVPNYEFLIETGLSRVSEDGEFVYVSGSKDQFAWILQKVNAGKTSGIARKRKSLEKSSNGEGTATNGDERLRTSYSYSYSYSDSENMCVNNKNDLSEKLSSCLEVWSDTLKHFKIKKDPKFDETSILRLIKSNGYEQTKLALIGIRSEAKTENFDPSKNVSVRRISNAKLFEKFVNLGAQSESRSEKKIKSLEDIDE